MAYYDIVWTEMNIDHLAQHGISQNDFEHVLHNPTDAGTSRSSGLPVVWGYTPDGRYIMAVYREIDEMTVLPVTGYEVPEPRE